MASGEAVAGGALSEELWGAVGRALDCYIVCTGDPRGQECRDCARSLDVDPSKSRGTELLKSLLREAGLKALVSGGWRSLLPGAMKLADRLLEEIARGYEAYYDYVVDFKAYLLDYGLVGTGSGLLQAFFEVGLHIDSLLGLPYYPASTIKGAARAAAEELLGVEAATALFGAPAAAGGGWMGLYTFAPSYPVGCLEGVHPCLVVTGDVVTPHYFKPGRGVVGPEFEAEPTPIAHAAIAPGTVFRFIVGIREPPEKLQEPVRAALERARKLGLLGQSRGGTAVDLARLASTLVASALLSGVAARSGKGYNILVPLPEGGGSITDNVVSLKVKRGGGGG